MDEVGVHTRKDYLNFNYSLELIKILQQKYKKDTRACLNLPVTVSFCAHLNRVCLFVSTETLLHDSKYSLSIIISTA